ncbi:uncharacterized protein LOC141900322 [Tubulanus polymorphus]|uniref:uncharacterized protein LOC141900322 n=1 Tax=Tubulanus polymorphus TaxID=672921 RepID=UPI003DA68495
MDRVMETINARLEKEPLDGQIVSIDTVVCKVDGQWWVETNGDIDWDTCSWADSPDKHTFQFLRIFYQVGPTFKELIGFHDFVPDRLASKQSIFDKSPVYTEFPSLVQSARIWSKKEGETLRITNVQTLKTQYDKTREKAFDRRSRLLPDVPFTMNVEDLPSVSFLRVAYVIPIGPDKILPLNSPFLSCKTFIPGSLPEDEGKYQSLHEVATYALAWLHATRSKVVCAEMFGPVRESSIKSCGLQATDTAVSSGEWSKDNNGHLQPLDGLYCIRVYIDGVIREPPEGWHLEAQPIIASKCEKCKVS